MSFRIQNKRNNKGFAALLLLGSLSNPALAQFQSVSLEATAFNNTNIGLGRTDHMNDFGLQLRIGGQSYFENSPGNGIFIGGDIATTKYDIYTNLDRTEISGNIGFVKKLGIGFNQPRITTSLALQYRNSDSQIRSGWSFSPSIQYSKNLSERTSIKASAEYYQFEADNRIAVAAGMAGWLASDDNPASIQNTQLHFAAEWAWTPSTYLAIDSSFIFGEFSSMALPTSGLSNYASAVSQDDVCGGFYYLYRYTGQGRLAGAEIIHTFTSDTELTFRFQRTYVDADAGKGYGQNLINLSFSKRF